MRRKKILIWGIIFIVLGVLIYRSPDSAYWIERDTAEAIEVGRIYAFGLFINAKQPGMNMWSIGLAKTKMDNYDFTQIESLTNIIEYIKKRNIAIPFPFIAEPKDMELVALERLESSLVMTFAYMPNFKRSIAEIPGKGKILFAIAAHYFEPYEDNSLLKHTYKFMRKIANLPVLRYYTGYAKAEGSWALIDFKYTYNMNDYYNWILKEGENYNLTNKVQKEWEEWHKKPIREFMEYVNRTAEKSIDFSYDWANQTMELQIKTIQERDKEYKKVFDSK